MEEAKRKPLAALLIAQKDGKEPDEDDEGPASGEEAAMQDFMAAKDAKGKADAMADFVRMCIAKDKAGGYDEKE